LESSAIYGVVLPYKNSAGVGRGTAIEGEQQIQNWEAEDLHMRAAASENVCNHIGKNRLKAK